MNEPIDYEREYDNRARFPEFPDVLALWLREAKRFRADARAELDIAYGPSPRQRLDLYLPDGDHGEAPVALLIHGGYWQRLDGRTYAHFARGLVESGLRVAVPSYDLCPSVPVGTIVTQMQRCALLLWQRFGRRLVAVGHSAGGHLAACLAGTDWRALDNGAPADLVRVCVPISGLFDLPPLVGTTVNQALRLDMEEAVRQSPVLWRPLPDGLRLSAHVGGRESSEYVRQSRDLARAWQTAGAATALRVVEGASHFSILDELLAPDSVMTQDILENAAQAAILPR
ncbi:alpha/beta hydrolase [Marinivivus vitaminiproducens]|uniref:alpha/beta hydrolase n=1 Tax=Marinivivus vitaminiproducens TaxID=3035935 RepID=UPI00279B94FA|nr:alpha/beta hydrolase [Geminicoccaceae bacterium SCSIO 64248]